MDVYALRFTPQIAAIRDSDFCPDLEFKNTTSLPSKIFRNKPDILSIECSPNWDSTSSQKWESHWELLNCGSKTNGKETTPSYKYKSRNHRGIQRRSLDRQIDELATGFVSRVGQSTWQVLSRRLTTLLTLHCQLIDLTISNFGCFHFPLP